MSTFLSSTTDVTIDGKPLTVAIMQPYFVPYGGYFRLFCAADIVVMFDCVQFPRRGWVHRNRLPTSSGTLDWLTLPIQRCERDTPISGLRFKSDAPRRLEEGLARFPLLARAKRNHDSLLERMLDIRTDSVATYLCELLAALTAMLSIDKKMLRSSDLGVPAELRGQERILWIARYLGATTYINPPGGRDLYTADAFSAAGIDLRFLRPYGGESESILGRLLREPLKEISAEIRTESVLVP
jgi:hypothetical protein